MSLDFLSSLLPLAGSLLNGKPKASSADTMAMNNMNQASSLLQGSIDPTNPILRALSTNEQQQNQYNLGSSLNQMMSMQRRAQAEGRPVQFFDPERADENMASMFSKQAVQGGYQANQDASTQMQTIAKALMGSLGKGGLMGLGNAQTALAGQQSTWNNNLSQGISTLLPMLMTL